MDAGEAERRRGRRKKVKKEREERNGRVERTRKKGRHDGWRTLIWTRKVIRTVKEYKHLVDYCVLC